MTDPAKPVSRPRWSYTRLSVRGLMVLVLMIAAWLGWIIHSARVQCRAVAALEQAGGSVKYDWEWKDGYPIPDSHPWAPEWLVARLGVDFVGNVVFVAFYGRASDAELHYVGQLRGLEALDLTGCPVTDPGLVQLAGLTSLEGLDLTLTAVSDARLGYVEGLTQLQSLWLSGTAVTDNGLGSVWHSSNVQWSGDLRP